MPLKHYKIEEKGKLALGKVLYSKRFGITVDRALCKGCVLCKLVCPKEAITLKPTPKSSEGKAQSPKVDIDETKCDFHAICAVVCPFGAIDVTVNNESGKPVVEKEAFPILLREIQIDSERCAPDCKICEEKCPLGVISVRFEPLTPEEMKDREKRGLPSTPNRTIVDVKEELCATCRICEAECPNKLIQVTKFIEGSLEIKNDLCPEGCHDCIDVCPVNALYLGEDNKVYVNDMFCIYCGACLNVCPKPEAVELSRTSIGHSPIKSGAWNKALENLTSTHGLNKELRSKRTGKARDVIKNLKRA